MNDEGQACITDFGLSQFWDKPGFTADGTFRWMACELLSSDEEEDNPKVSEASDTWAFGMTVLEVRFSIVFLSLAQPHSFYVCDSDSQRGSTFLLDQRGFQSYY